MNKRVLLITTFILIIIIYFNIYQFLPSHRKILQDSLKEKIDTISKLSVPIITKALKNQDDITIIKQIESIMQIKEINEVYILDTNGRVVMHNKTNQWDKTFDNDLTTKIINTESSSIHRKERGFVYSVPLEYSKILCIGFSSERFLNILGSFRKDFIYTAIIDFIVIFIVLVVFSYNQIKLPSLKLEKILKAISLGSYDKIHMPDNAEFKEIYTLINNILDKLRNEQEFSKSSSNSDKLAVFTGEAFSKLGYGVAFINSDNHIAYIDDNIKNFFKLEGTDGMNKHILDVFKKSVVIDIIQKASKNVNKLVEEKINSKVIKTFTIENELGNLGTVILLERNV